MEKEHSIVFTNKAKCRDCYRCVRACPVNAIKIENEQASVIAERCIACGTCIRECPQQAKAYKSHSDAVLRMLDNGLNPAITIAPSFIALLENWQIKRFPSALRQAGFSFVTETSVAAWYVSQETAKIVMQENDEKSLISSACPAVVNYIEKYRPQLIDKLIPVLSPAMAHARMLRKKLPKKCPVVFAGPCIAKKAEAEWKANNPFIDAVLTFSELMQIFNQKGIDFNSCEESEFDELVPGDARLYPLEGGLLKTSGISTDMLSHKVISVSGIDEVRDILDQLPLMDTTVLVEPLFCKGGCINGPDFDCNSSVFDRRNKIIAYHKQKQIQTKAEPLDVSISTSFHFDVPAYSADFTEDEIREVLERTGKANPDNQLNCGACGYNSCRENAIAVLMGLAEPTMCIPYMRRLAEQKSDSLFRTDPNGIIILDDKFKIQGLNPAFKRMFSCSDAIVGKPVSYLIDPEPFEKLLSEPSKPIHRVLKYNSYNLVCHQIHYAISEENHLIGIFIDITNVKKNEMKLRDIKSNAIIQAQELLDHQIEMSQKMARFLGENTAKGELLMRNLIDALEDNDES